MIKLSVRRTASILKHHNNNIRFFSTTKIMASATEAPWHAAFPKPKAQAEFISREDTLALFSSAKPGKDFILVDVRRTDFEVCYMRARGPAIRFSF